MTTISQELAQKANIKPKLQLGQQQKGGGVKSTGMHTVTFLNDRIVEGKHFTTGVERNEVEYIFEESGTKKTYNVSVYSLDNGGKPKLDDEGNPKLNYFVARMSELNYGDELTLEMVNKGSKNHIDIKYEGNNKSTTDEGVPTVEIDEDRGLGGDTEQKESDDEIPYNED